MAQDKEATRYYIFSTQGMWKCDLPEDDPFSKTLKPAHYVVDKTHKKGVQHVYFFQFPEAVLWKAVKDALVQQGYLYAIRNGFDRDLDKAMYEMNLKQLLLKNRLAGGAPAAPTPALIEDGNGNAKGFRRPRQTQQEPTMRRSRSEVAQMQTVVYEPEELDGYTQELS